MELRVLRYFLAVAREQSITAAAETLHITQPTLSKQLRELEEELGKKLFTRGNRKITLTEEGMFLRKRAQEIVELADKTEADFAAGVGSISGDIFIGSGETGAVRYLGRTLYKMRSRYPGIRFHLFSGNGEDVSDRLDKGLIDFALFVGMTDLKKYDYLKLPYHHRWGLILRKDDPLAAHEAVTPEMLMNVPILCSRQALIQNELSGWLGRPFEELNPAGTYNLIYNAAIMVEEGLGCAVCIDKLLDTSGESAVCFRPFEPAIDAELFIAWKKYQFFSAAAGKFLEMLQQELD
ncbi:Hca operon transcriptional activator [uncultured Eubacterium sp.]|uniref:LysR family transcriptional regulator n=1 Tax=Brotomerdimonas butyrica TaxID=2981721 RepID=UPI000823310C|nr:LysR family transcriptional regulator [Brotomerdimonas butyrica]MCU6755603.1 LysR family transcriptional regulator [Brotomerdimonas butyrica]SCH39533.1 Hca operon transcriptional activator [uncultured Eubacterium sp.]